MDFGLSYDRRFDCIAVTVFSNFPVQLNDLEAQACQRRAPWPLYSPGSPVIEYPPKFENTLALTLGKKVAIVDAKRRQGAEDTSTQKLPQPPQLKS